MSIFRKTVRKPIGFSTFPLGRTTLVGANFGELVPVFVQEVLPNDKFKVVGNANIEFAPMIAPMMHNVKASFHYFYVPDRLLFKDFETAFTGSRDGRSLPEDEVPEMPGFIPQTPFPEAENVTKVADRMVASSLFDYLEYPVSEDDQPDEKLSTSSLWMSDLPLRAYFKIWYDWYRDENLQYKNWDNDDFADYYEAWETWFDNSLSYFDAINYCLPNLNVRHRSYKKDYFTAALPSPQKGEPVVLSLGDKAPVGVPSNNQNRLIGNFSLGQPYMMSSLSGENLNALWVPFSEFQTTKMELASSNVNGSFIETVNALTGQGRFDIPANTLYADLSQATQVTINELRTAFAVQRILEAINLGGSRYNEYLLGQYGTAPTDLRLNRPQFLGGWHTQVAVQKVLQNYRR